MAAELEETEVNVLSFSRTRTGRIRDDSFRGTEDVACWRSGDKVREEMKEEHVGSLCEGRRCRDAEGQLGGR